LFEVLARGFYYCLRPSLARGRERRGWRLGVVEPGKVFFSVHRSEAMSEHDPQPTAGRSGFSRREFLGSTAAAAAATIVPAHVLGGPGKTPPSDQLPFVQIGAGGRGNADLRGVAGAGGRVVGLCDVDPKRARGAFNRHSDAPTFKDYRKLLDKVGDKADAAVVSTPDHSHAVQAAAAIRRGMHVYVEKPLAHSYEECQALLDQARANGVIGQMGNQGHSGGGLELWKKMAEAGEFGEIDHVHVWTDRPGNWWPQGMDERPEKKPAPDHLAWDLWLGPQADRPYGDGYHPFAWRGWWDFGTGAIGDMACHNADPAFWALGLGMPRKVHARASSATGVAFPNWSIIDFEFAPAAGSSKPIRMSWYDGGKKPEKPDGAHPGMSMGGNGCMIVGQKLAAKGGGQAGMPAPIAVPGEKFGKPVKEAQQRWKEARRAVSGSNHHANFVKAALNNDRSLASSELEYAAPMTQALLLGAIALRYPGQTLEWDDKKKQFANHSEANQWLTLDPRKGFPLRG
jgi:predicted dehydrogenase